MAKPKATRAGVIHLTPNIRFGATNARARCSTVWQRLLCRLYELDLSAEEVSAIRWEIDLKSACVSAGPVLSAEVDESALWKANPQARRAFFPNGGGPKSPWGDRASSLTGPGPGSPWGDRASSLTGPGPGSPWVMFEVDDFVADRRELQSNGQSDECKKLELKFRKWISRNVVEAFHSESAMVEYSWFNQTDAPFSFWLETEGFSVGRASSKSKLWSGQSSVKTRPQRRKAPARSADYSVGGWRRFYFDDGETRRYWYVRCRGECRTIAQGRIGSRARETQKSFASAKAAKDSMNRAIEKKGKQGYVQYDVTDFAYRRKNRFAIKLIRRAMEEFESEYGVRIAEEYRRHLLQANAGSLEVGSFVSLPGHRRKRVEVQEVLGFKTDPAWDLAYNAAGVHLPAGWTLVAGAPDTHLVLDELGAVRIFATERLDERDKGDDNVIYMDHLPSFVVAHSFGELLTRIRKFPGDVQTPESADGDATLEDFHGVRPTLTELDEKLRESELAAEEQHFRRFFFIDGAVQKYWHINLSGNEFTTSYNKYGRSPATTTKSFPSAAQAQKAFQRIIAQKLRKGYREVLPDALVLYSDDHGKPATEREVKRLESEIGYELPEEYRHFLKTQNGGEPLPGFLLLPTVPAMDNVAVACVLGLDNERGPSIRSERATYPLPDGHLPVAVGKDLFSLSLRSRPGCVYFWDGEVCDFDEKLRIATAHLVAHCFDEFLTRLALFRGKGQP